MHRCMPERRVDDHPGVRKGGPNCNLFLYLSLFNCLPFDDYKRCNTNEKNSPPRHVVVRSASATSAAALSPDWIAPSM